MAGSTSNADSNPALRQAAELVSRKMAERIAQEKKLEFAKKSEAEMRAYEREQTDSTKKESAKLAQEILEHKKGDQIDRVPRLSDDETKNFRVMSSEEIIGELLGNIKAGESHGVFDIPAEASEQSASQRQANADALVQRKGIVTNIILHHLSSGESSQAATLLSRLTVAVNNRPDAIPAAFGLELAHHFESLAAHDNTTATKNSLEAMRDFAAISGIDEIVPGFSDFKPLIEAKIVEIEKTEEVERTKRLEKTKAEMHANREVSFEDDAFGGAKAIAEVNFEMGGNITSKDVVLLGEGKDGYNHHLGIILESPAIRKAINDAGLTELKLVDPLVQLEALFIIQTSPSLMEEAVRALSTAVDIDWTGWTKADYIKAKQDQRWEQNWRSHIESTISGYALGMVEAAVNSPDVANRTAVIQRAMDVLMGEAGYGVDLTTNESIRERFGKNSSRSRAIIRFGEIIARDQVLFEQIIDGELTDRPRLAGVRERLILTAEDQRAAEARAEQEKLSRGAIEIENAEKGFKKIISGIDVALAQHQLLIELCNETRRLDSNDYLEVIWGKGKISENGKPVDIPILIIRPTTLEEINRAIAKEEKNIEALESKDDTPPASIFTAKRKLANERVKLLIVNQLQVDAASQNSRIKYSTKDKHAYGDLGTIGADYYQRGTEAKDSDQTYYEQRLDKEGPAAIQLIQKLSEQRAALVGTTGKAAEEIIKQIEQTTREIRALTGGIEGVIKDLTRSTFIDRAEDILIKDALVNANLKGVKGSGLNSSKRYYKKEVSFNDPVVSEI